MAHYWMHTCTVRWTFCVQTPLSHSTSPWKFDWYCKNVVTTPKEDSEKSCGGKKTDALDQGDHQGDANLFSLVLRLHLSFFIFMDDLLASKIDGHEVIGSSYHLVQSSRDAPYHAIQILKDDARIRVVDRLRIWRRIIELADEGRALRKHCVCVGRWCPRHDRCIHIMTDTDKTSDALSYLFLDYVCLMKDRRYWR